MQIALHPWLFVNQLMAVDQLAIVIRLEFFGAAQAQLF